MVLFYEKRCSEATPVRVYAQAIGFSFGVFFKKKIPPPHSGVLKEGRVLCSKVRFSKYRFRSIWKSSGMIFFIVYHTLVNFITGIFTFGFCKIISDVYIFQVGTIFVLIQPQFFSIKGCEFTKLRRLFHVKYGKSSDLGTLTPQILLVDVFSGRD